MNAGAPADALPHLERAAALRPENARFQVSLAWALLQLQRVDASIAACRRAVELEPEHAPAHHHLGNALTELGDRGGAIASYRRAVELDPSDFRAHSNLILVALTDPGWDAARLGAEARAWAKLHAEPLRVHQRPHPNDRDPDRRLRVGYVSPDFRGHAVGQFVMPLLRHHDPAAVEVYLYASVERPDFATEEYREMAGDRFRDIRRVDDVDAAELVRRDRIDVLVDLAVHGAGHRLRLFACKPAPVQMTWVGYAGTTGLDAVDHRITDHHFDPPGTDLGVYSEASLHLPEAYWCYDALEDTLQVGPLPALAAGGVTFGCLGSPRKLHAGVLSLWGRVLAAVPGARLYVYLEEHGREAALRTLAAAGVPAERVEFGGRVSRREYLERYHRIDVVLDTFPFGGGTTSLDAAWMGVPVVTWNGGPTLQRAGTTIAMNLGLPELVATSEDDFVAKAVALTSDLSRLARLRAELRPRLVASPFGDAARFARHIEAAYRTGWRRFCAAG
jgi:predicted O-linked N-acetylglucosamine transferase (SPINDLY family)